MTYTLSVSPTNGHFNPVATTTAFLPGAAVGISSTGIDSYTTDANFVANPSLRPAGDLAGAWSDLDGDELGLVQNGVVAGGTHDRVHNDIGEIAELSAGVFAGSRVPLQGAADDTLLAKPGDEKTADGPSTCRPSTTNSVVQQVVINVLEGLFFAGKGGAAERISKALFYKAGIDLFQHSKLALQGENVEALLLGAYLTFDEADNRTDAFYVLAELLRKFLRRKPSDKPSAFQSATADIADGVALAKQGNAVSSKIFFDKAGDELFHRYHLALQGEDTALILLSALLAFHKAGNSEKVGEVLTEIAKVTGIVQRGEAALSAVPADQTSGDDQLFIEPEVERYKAWLGSSSGSFRDTVSKMPQIMVVELVTQAVKEWFMIPIEIRKMLADEDEDPNTLAAEWFVEARLRNLLAGIWID